MIHMFIFKITDSLIYKFNRKSIQQLEKFHLVSFGLEQVITEWDKKVKLTIYDSIYFGKYYLETSKQPDFITNFQEKNGEIENVYDNIQIHVCVALRSILNWIIKCRLKDWALWAIEKLFSILNDAFESAQVTRMKIDESACFIGHLDSLYLVVLFVCVESNAFARFGGWHSMRLDCDRQLHTETNHSTLNYRIARNANLDSMRTCLVSVLPLGVMYLAKHFDFLRLMHSIDCYFELRKDEGPKTWPIDCGLNPMRILMVVWVLLFHWIRLRHIDFDLSEINAAAGWYRLNWADVHRCQRAVQICHVEQSCLAAFHLIVVVFVKQKPVLDLDSMTLLVQLDHCRSISVMKEK